MSTQFIEVFNSYCTDAEPGQPARFIAEYSGPRRWVRVDRVIAIAQKQEGVVQLTLDVPSGLGGEISTGYRGGTVEEMLEWLCLEEQ